MSAMTLKGWKKVNTGRIKDPFLAVALLLAFIEHSLHWGAAWFAAGTALTLSIIEFRALIETDGGFGAPLPLAILQVAAGGWIASIGGAAPLTRGQRKGRPFLHQSLI
jgi:hypothetical protein